MPITAEDLKTISSYLNQTSLPPSIRSILHNFVTHKSVPTTTAIPKPKLSKLSKDLRSFQHPDDVATTFDLHYSDYGARYHFSLGNPHTPIPSQLPHVTRFIEGYIYNFERNSEATCRSPVDVLLNECLCLLKGFQFDGESGRLLDLEEIELQPPTTTNPKEMESQRPTTTTPRSSSDSPTATPTPTPSPTPTPIITSTSTTPYEPPAFISKVVINGEVNVNWTHPTTAITYTGRLDYVIGIGDRTSPQHTLRSIRIPYQAYLLIVEAKRTKGVESATAQLFAYMAILYKLRLESTSTSIPRAIFGIATDGLTYDFLQIDKNGYMKIADRIQIWKPGMVRRVVSGVIWILEKEAERSKNAMGCRG